MIKIYHFEDLHDFLALNRKLSRFGVTVQQDLFGAYVACVEETRMNSRRMNPTLETVQTPLSRK